MCPGLSSGLLLTAQRSQCFPYLTIRASRVLRGSVDELGPAATVGVELCMTEQVTGLQNRFQRVAQIVGESPQVLDTLVLDGGLW